MIRPVVGTTAALLAEAWFALVALLDRALAYYPRRWGRHGDDGIEHTWRRT